MTLSHFLSFSRTVAPKYAKQCASLALAGACVLSTPPSAHAAPITYNEATDGDLADDISLNVFTLGVGTNSFSGTIAALPTRDGDIIQFNLAEGTRLTGITTTALGYRQSGGTTNGWAFGSSLFEILPGTGMGLNVSPIQNQSVDLEQGVFPVSDSQVSSAFPLGRTTEYYALDIGNGGALIGQVQSSETDYRVTFEVETIPVGAVPLPAGVWLLIGGIGALAALRRRTKHS